MKSLTTLVQSTSSLSSERTLCYWLTRGQTQAENRDAGSCGCEQSFVHCVLQVLVRAAPAFERVDSRAADAKFLEWISIAPLLLTGNSVVVAGRLSAGRENYRIRRQAKSVHEFSLYPRHARQKSNSSFSLRVYGIQATHLSYDPLHS